MIWKLTWDRINSRLDTTEEMTCEFEDIPNNVEESAHNEIEKKDETKRKRTSMSWDKRSNGLNICVTGFSKVGKRKGMGKIVEEVIGKYIPNLVKNIKAWI